MLLSALLLESSYNVLSESNNGFNAVISSFISPDIFFDIAISLDTSSGEMTLSLYKFFISSHSGCNFEAITSLAIALTIMFLIISPNLFSRACIASSPAKKASIHTPAKSSAADLISVPKRLLVILSIASDTS